MVEDNPGDVRLIEIAFKDAEISHNLMIAPDGLEATRILNQEGKYSNAKRPHLIILDLNLPKKSGMEVLKETKEDEKLKTIPIIILTTSKATEDIKETYQNHANAYIIKPNDIDQLIKIVKSIEDFWLKKVNLP